MREVQADTEDHEKSAKSKRGGQEQVAIKTSTTIINMRLKQTVVAFQLFLQEHQDCVKQQEAKKESIMRGGVHQQSGAYGRSQTSVGSTSLSNKRKFLPHHVNQM